MIRRIAAALFAMGLASCARCDARRPVRTDAHAVVAVAPAEGARASLDALAAALGPPRPLVLAPEGRREFPPAPPPGCAIRAPVRAVDTGPGDALFATAGGGGRALLTVAAGEVAADASAVTPFDSATWVLERGARDPVAQRGPLGAGTTSLAASGNGAGLAIAWAVPGATDRLDGAVRVALFARGASAVTLLAQPDPAVTDLACSDAGCALAVGWRDRFAPPDSADRAAFIRFDPATAAPPFARTMAPDSRHPFNAFAPTAAHDPRAGTVETLASQHEFAPSPVPIADSVLDAARIDDTVYAVLATAPTDERCQPGAWRVELATLALDGSTASTTPVALVDARPVGARVRSLGHGAPPLVTWLDAPQCSDRFFVARAFRAGYPSTVALADCTEYDVATDAATVWIALRSGSRIRWYASDCDAADR